jgi:hypothetical protein
VITKLLTFRDHRRGPCPPCHTPPLVEARTGYAQPYAHEHDRELIRSVTGDQRIHELVLLAHGRRWAKYEARFLRLILHLDFPLVPFNFAQTSTLVKAQLWLLAGVLTPIHSSPVT